uniref:Uncharacterized protein n=1 Tax=Anguilla anguilla TaxID=7936 RepID=A0A0E9SS74_ANGAN
MLVTSGWIRLEMPKSMSSVRRSRSQISRLQVTMDNSMFMNGLNRFQHVPPVELPLERVDALAVP